MKIQHCFIRRTNLKRTFFSILAIVVSLLTLEACKHEKSDLIDDELLKKSKITSGFVWFKNSDSYLDKSSGTGHNYSYLKTRYNDIAARKLDSNGKIIAGSKFDEGSLIVKELFKEKGKVDRYAILYKDSKNENADANGWVWGYVDSDGRVAASAAEKGKACISCHSQSDNIDYMLMNKFFP